MMIMWKMYLAPSCAMSLPFFNAVIYDGGEQRVWSDHVRKPKVLLPSLALEVNALIHLFEVSLIELLIGLKLSRISSI